MHFIFHDWRQYDILFNIEENFPCEIVKKKYFLKFPGFNIFRIFKLKLALPLIKVIKTEILIFIRFKNASLGFSVIYSNSPLSIDWLCIFDSQHYPWIIHYAISLYIIIFNLFHRLHEKLWMRERKCWKSCDNVKSRNKNLFSILMEN